MNMNMNMNGRRRRRNARNQSIMTELFAGDESSLSESLENLDLHNYCQGRLSTSQTQSIESCSEELLGETIIKTFSLMHEYFNNPDTFEYCIHNQLKSTNRNELLMEKIITSSFQDGFM